MTTTDTAIPQNLVDAATEAGLQLTRTRDGALELSNTTGQGILFTTNFEHEIPEFCADGGAKFKKRFDRPKEEAAADDDEVEVEVTDDDDDPDGELTDLTTVDGRHLTGREERGLIAAICSMLSYLEAESAQDILAVAGIRLAPPVDDTDGG